MGRETTMAKYYKLDRKNTMTMRGGLTRATWPTSPTLQTRLEMLNWPTRKAWVRRATLLAAIDRKAL